MPSIQDTTYPRIKSTLTEKELDEIYTPQRKEIAWAESKSKGSLQQVALLVLMKSVQKLGIFKSVDEIPEVIVQHIAIKASLPVPEKENWSDYSHSRTAKRHVRFVRDYFQIRPFGQEGEKVMVDTMTKLAYSSNKENSSNITTWCPIVSFFTMYSPYLAFYKTIRKKDMNTIIN